MDSKLAKIKFGWGAGQIDGSKTVSESFFFHGTQSRPGYGKLHPHSPSLSTKQAENAGIDLATRIRSPRSVATDNRPVGSRNGVGSYDTIPGAPDGETGYEGVGKKLNILGKDFDKVAKMAEATEHLRKSRDGTHGDHELAAIFEVQGFNNKPRVVDDEGLQRHIKAGATEVMRGLTDVAFYDQFRDGSHYVGIGVHGNGTYTAKQRFKSSAGTFTNFGDITAKSYATKKNSSDGDTYELMHMAVSKKARLITEEKAKKLERDTYDKLEDRKSAMHADWIKSVGNTTEFNRIGAEIERITKVQKFIGDPGRISALHGFDGIDVQRAGYVVLLNRGASIVSRKNRRIPANLGLDME